MEWPHILKLNRESLLLLIKDCDYCIGPFMYKVQSWSLLEEVGRMVTLEGWIVPKGDVSGLWKASHVLCIDLEAGKCVCSVCEKIVKTPLTVWALFSLYWLPQKCFLKWDQFFPWYFIFFWNFNNPISCIKALLNSIERELLFAFFWPFLQRLFKLLSVLKSLK